MSHDTFNPGEIAIAMNWVNAEMDGREVEVLSGPDWMTAYNSSTGQWEHVFGYYVRTECTHRCACRHDRLRKRKPPQDPAYVKFRDQLVREFAMGAPTHV